MSTLGSEVFGATILISTIAMLLIKDVPKNWWKVYAAKAVLYIALSTGFLFNFHFKWYTWLVPISLLWQLYKDAMNHVKGKPED